MTDVYTIWRTKGGAPSGDVLPPQADCIADELPANAQMALLNCKPWALDIDQPSRLQLEFAGLLDEEGTALNAMGVAVLRTLLRRDIDFHQRKREYDRRFGELYADAYYTARPAHKVAKAALFVDPVLHPVLLDVVADKRPLMLTTRTHQEHARALADGGMVTIREWTRKGVPLMLADATRFGRNVAAMLKLAAVIHDQVFAGAKPSAFQADLIQKEGWAYNVATRALSTGICVIEQQANGGTA